MKEALELPSQTMKRPGSDLDYSWEYQGRRYRDTTEVTAS